MSTGLLALVDDVIGIAKVAASSLDDVVGQAAKAGSKAAGVVIDDAAVTPSYVVGFAAERELPIVWKIALGSLRNKLLFLLPAAIVLSLVAPWAITPLLMIGGAYLCYEGTEKVFEALWPHEAHHHEEVVAGTTDPVKLENQKVRGAIQTDFILSAEIMAITLAAVEDQSIWLQGFVLAIVGLGITVIVYGAVALIVKADDAGVALAASGRGGAVGSLGRGIVLGMPVLLRVLSIVGTAAMVWVGGGIIVHGLEEFGLDGPAHWIHDVAVAAGEAVPAVHGFIEWLVNAAMSGIAGLVVGAILIPIVQWVAPPIQRLIRRLRRQPSVQSHPQH